MAKKAVGFVKLQIPAGKANPAPPVGTALGPQGINIMAFCKEFNARTQGQDTILPVEITIFADKSFTFILKTPLKGPGVSLTDVLRATEYVVPSLELVDARLLDRRGIPAPANLPWSEHLERLPRASAERENVKPETIRLSVTADGKYHWNETDITDAELEPRLPCLPVGPAFAEEHWRPTPQEIAAFFEKRLPSFKGK